MPSSSTSRRGPRTSGKALGIAVAHRSIAEFQAAGCAWLFVNLEPKLAPFYLEACGFRSTPAGLVRPRELGARRALIGV